MTTTDHKKFRYGAYDLMRKNNRNSALKSFGIDSTDIEKIDSEMKNTQGKAWKKWSIFGCFEEEESEEKSTK